MHKTILENTLSGGELGSMLVSLLLAVVFLYGCDKAAGTTLHRQVTLDERVVEVRHGTGGDGATSVEDGEALGHFPGKR